MVFGDLQLGKNCADCRFVADPVQLVDPDGADPERVGRQSFFGQGAGRFPTASNVVQDCLTILSGDKSFYTGKADTAQLDGSAEAHPYYVRTAAPDDFLRSVTADHWGAGVVTSAVNTYAMLAWARRQLAADPACFIAGIR